MSTEPVKPAAKRPRHDNNHKYEFNCCPLPEVWKFDDGSYQCLNCGYVWTEELDG